MHPLNLDSHFSTIILYQEELRVTFCSFLKGKGRRRGRERERKRKKKKKGKSSLLYKGQRSAITENIHRPRAT